MAAFKELLADRQNDPETRLTAEATWAEVSKGLEGEAGYDECSQVTRLDVWGEFIQALIKEEHAAWVAEDATRFRKERKSVSSLGLKAPSPWQALASPYTLESVPRMRSSCSVNPH